MMFACVCNLCVMVKVHSHFVSIAHCAIFINTGLGQHMLAVGDQTWTQTADRDTDSWTSTEFFIHPIVENYSVNSHIKST